MAEPSDDPSGVAKFADGLMLFKTHLENGIDALNMISQAIDKMNSDATVIKTHGQSVLAYRQTIIRRATELRSTIVDVDAALARIQASADRLPSK